MFCVVDKPSIWLLTDHAFEHLKKCESGGFTDHVLCA